MQMRQTGQGDLPGFFVTFLGWPERDAAVGAAFQSGAALARPGSAEDVRMKEYL